MASKKRHLMILGTGSGAGKSLIALAICRYFARNGLKVAPFKAQNMALNAYVTAQGGEIGMAQAMQAEASMLQPHTDMNPILLKSSGKKGIQVILNGKVHTTMTAKQYYAFRDTAWEIATSAFDRLSSNYEHIILEGAGSPAEINLLDVDIANIAMAQYANARCILVADIDKGGVFASLYGTVKLLKQSARRIKAFLINKFRGDIDILLPGYDMLWMELSRPVIGTVPYIADIKLPEEDSLVFNSTMLSICKEHAEIKVAIIKLPRIANFTDFDPLFHEPDVDVQYTLNPTDIQSADLVILPGTKNTTDDLQFIYDNGLHQSILLAYKKGALIFGLCGGYQMLGLDIYDPNLIEGSRQHVKGLGLLDIETVFEPQKTTRSVYAKMSGCDETLYGYEIHMGKSTGNFNLFEILCSDFDGKVLEGCVKANCMGTYLHGIFDNDSFRRFVINLARANKGLKAYESGINYKLLKQIAIDKFTDRVTAHIDMQFVETLIK